MNTLVKTEITATGLKGLESVDEKEFFDFGVKLATAEKGLQWAIGDWYNNIRWGDKKAACERVGLNYKTAVDYGFIAGKFQSSVRTEHLAFKHYKIIISPNLPKTERTRLLKLAASNKWSSARLKAERDIILGIAKVEPHKEFAHQVDALADAVVKALPKTAGKRAINAAIKGIKKVASDLQHEFTKAVGKGVTEGVKERFDNMRAAEEEVKAERERLIKQMAGVKAFMTKDEFLLIRSCLHPDKNTHPKADKAFKIFNRLADVKNWEN